MIEHQYVLSDFNREMALCQADFTVRCFARFLPGFDVSTDFNAVKISSNVAISPYGLSE